MDPATALDLQWTPPNSSGIPPITGYDVQYRLQSETDWIDHVFDSVGTTTNTTISDLESNTTYQVQVRAINDEGEGEWAPTTGTTKKADLTVAFRASTYTVDEGGTATVTVTVTPNADRNVRLTVTMTGTGATLSGLGTGNTLTIARGHSSGSFDISGDQDDDAVNSEAVLALNSDDDGVSLGSPSSTIVTTIDNEVPNNPPVVTTSSPMTVEENQTAAAVLEATDSDGDPIVSWSITGGADSALFNLTIDGTLSFNNAPDFENPIDDGRDNGYEVEVTASDGTGDSTPKTINIAVTDVNEPPRFSESVSTTRRVTENSPEYTPVGGLFYADDPERDPLVYELLGTGYENFTVDANGQITVASNAVLDFELQPTFILELSVSDTKDRDGNPDPGADDSVTITINLTDVVVPPQMDEYPGFSTSGTEDPTSMLTLTWTRPDLPDAAASITGYEVQYRVQGETVWVVHDFDSSATTIQTTITGLASNTSYDAQVRAINAEGPGEWSPTSIAKTTEADLTIAFSAATYTVDEGGTATSTVAVNPTADRNVTVTITMSGTGATLSDLDTNNALAITRGQSSATFTISGDEDNDAIDNMVILTLTTDDDGVSVGSPSTSTVTIIDDEIANFPPAFATTTVNWTIPEDSTVGTLLGDPVAATDPEDDSLTYSLSGKGSDLFEVDDQGQVTLIANLNHEATPSYTLNLSVSDGKDDVGNSNSETDASVTVNITVEDVDEPPGSVEPVVVTSLSICKHPSRAEVSVEPVMVTSLSSSELLACWSKAPNTGPYYVEYEAQYRERGQDDWVKLDLKPGSDSDFDDATETAISGLDSNTTYEVQVRAHNDEGEGPWGMGSGITEKADLSVAFKAPIYMVKEGEEAPITVTVTPTADRDVAVTVAMTGAGATLSGLKADNTLTITRGQKSEAFTITGDQDGDAVDSQVTLSLRTGDDKVGLDNSTTVTIIDDDEANLPAQFAETTVNLFTPENLPVDTFLGDPISATDPEGDPLTYSLSGEGSQHFEVDNYGQLKLSAILNHENASSYTLIMTVSDGKDGIGNPDSDTDDTVTINIEVEDLDEPPDALTNVTVSTNAENPTTALDVTWVSPDTAGIPEVTGHNMKYRAGSSGEWTAHDFNSDGSTTETTVPSLASNTTYEVQVRAKNEEGDGPWAEGVGSTERTGLVVVFSPATYTVREGEPATTTLIVTPVADRDVTVTVNMTGPGVALSGLDIGNKLTVTRGQSSGSFIVSGDQDNDAVDGEVTLTLGTDDERVSFDNSATITIVDDDDPNLPPQFTTTTVNLSVPENFREGQLLGDPISATDPEGDPLTYSLSGEGSQHFEVDNYGQLKLSAILNHENASSYTLIMTVSDGKDGIGNPDSDTDDTVTINIEVEDLDEPPDALTNVTVSTNAENPTTALDVTWVSPDTAGIPEITGHNMKYRAGSSGEWTAHDFDSDGSTTETTIPSLASNTTYEVQVRAKNEEGDGPWAEGVGSTERTGLVVVFSPATYTVREGEPATTTLIVTPVADRDVTVTVNMTGPGVALSGLDIGNKLTVTRGQSSGSFIVSGDQDNDAVDGEVTLTLGTDDERVSFDNSATITIVDDDDPNLPPQFATTTVNLSVPENFRVGQPLGAPVSATDPEDDPLTYSLSGEGSQHIKVNDRGQLTLSGTLNHENAPYYTLILSVSDGKDGIGNPDSATDASITIIVKVQDVDEPPDTPTNVMVSTNAGNPTTALDVTWTPPHTSGIPTITGYDVQYRRLGQNAWLVHNSSGTATETSLDGLNSGTTYEVRIQAKNEEGESIWSAFGRGSTHAADMAPEHPRRPAPPAESSSGDRGGQLSNTAPRFDSENVTFEVNETSAKGSLVGRPVIANDGDRNDRITYSILGSDTTHFSVDRKSGQITLTTELDFETKHTYFMTMIATDREGLKDEIDITIKVRNVDEPGAVIVSSNEPKTGKSLTAVLADPDGSLSEVVWQWQASLHGIVWTNLERASSSGYIPVSSDESMLLRATAAYTDGHGLGKGAISAATVPVLPSPDIDASVLAAIASKTNPGQFVTSPSLSSDYPVQAEVWAPVPGWVSIIMHLGEDWQAPRGFDLLGATFDITSPTASVAMPIVIRFHISSQGSLETPVVFKDSKIVEDCTSAKAQASPDPCVSDRRVENRTVLITTLTSEASIWQIGIAEVAPTPTPTREPARAPIATSTPTPPATPTLVPNPTPAPDPAPTPVPQATPIHDSAMEPTPVPQPTPTPTPPFILIQTATSQPTPPPVLTFTPTSSPPPSPTSSPSPSPTSTPSPTSAPSPSPSSTSSPRGTLTPRATYPSISTLSETPAPLPIGMPKSKPPETETPMTVHTPTLTPTKEPLATPVSTVIPPPIPPSSKIGAQGTGLPSWMWVSLAVLAFGLAGGAFLLAGRRPTTNDSVSAC